MTASAKESDREDVTRLLLVENCPDELDFGAYVSFDASASAETRAHDRQNGRRRKREGWVALPSAQMELLMKKLPTFTNVKRIDFSGKTTLKPLAPLVRLG